jgi:hypothetical protein
MNEDQDEFPSPCQLSPAEQTTYRMLYAAAECGMPCPDNIGIEVANNFSSCSMGSKMIRRLEEKGLVRVERYHQRARRVLIIATDKWTANAMGLALDKPHVPKGAKLRCENGTYSIGKRKPQ